MARRDHAARRDGERPTLLAGMGPPVIAVPVSPALTDAEWARVAALLVRAPADRSTRRVRHDARRVVPASGVCAE